MALVALIFGLAQTLGFSGVFGPRDGDANAYAAALDPQRPASAVMQDEEDGDDDDADNEDEDADADNEESDEDADNEDGDADADNSESDKDADNEDAEVDGDNTDDEGDNGDGSTGALPIEDAALKQPLTQVTGTSTGGDVLVATPGERVALRMFSWMPSGIQVTIRPVDATTLVGAPTGRVSDLAFIIEAKDAMGVPLTSLPAEVNLAIRYADSAVSNLNEDNLTIARLNTTTNQWVAAPKLVKDAASNYVASSTSELGTYVVYAQ